MLLKSSVLSGLVSLVCIGTLLAAEKAGSEGIDPAELSTKAWVALKAGDHEQVSELTTQCFKEFGDEAVRQQRGSGEELLKKNASSFHQNSTQWEHAFLFWLNHYHSRETPRRVRPY